MPSNSITKLNLLETFRTHVAPHRVNGISAFGVGLVGPHVRRYERGDGQALARRCSWRVRRVREHAQEDQSIRCPHGSHEKLLQSNWWCLCWLHQEILSYSLRTPGGSLPNFLFLFLLLIA